MTSTGIFRNAPRQHREEAQERRLCGSTKPRPRGEDLEEVNATRGSARRTPGNAGPPGTDSADARTPEAEIGPPFVLADDGTDRCGTARGAGGVERRAGYCRGKPSESEKPKGATGMKQGRRGWRRSNASRGRGSPWTPRSRGRQPRHESLPPSACVEGQETPWKTAAFRTLPGMTRRRWFGELLDRRDVRTLRGRLTRYPADPSGSGSSVCSGASRSTSDGRSS